MTRPPDLAAAPLTPTAAEVDELVADLLAATLQAEPPQHRSWRMPAQRAHLPLGGYLLGYGYLRPQQLIGALQQQHQALASREPVLLGDLLIAQELISPRVLATLVTVQLANRLRATPSFQPTRLGEQLVFQRCLSPAQLAGVIQLQAWLRARGTAVRLGELLVQQNLATRDDVGAALRQLAALQERAGEPVPGGPGDTVDPA